MWDLLLHVARHTLEDSLKTLPFLFLAYLLIEYIEHRASDRFQAWLAGFGRFGALCGALLGCVPQCGFSVTAANLYSGRVITLGTLVAVFVSTSDEAIPVLLGHADSWGIILQLILIKVVLAILVGLVIDLLCRRAPSADRQRIHALCHHCGCEHGGILRSAVRHTLSIFLFILLVTLLLNLGVEWLGEERLARLLMSDTLLQPVIAALIGFIPNCAASVLLTELYLAGSISLGSIVAGLTTGAGVGLAVLFRVNRPMKSNFAVVGLLLATGVLAGIAIDLLGIGC